MNQQPDKFFRDKLEHYQKPAPATAWDKIAAAQTKKNDKGLWLKIAASLLVLAVAGYVLWPSTTSVEQPESNLSEIPATQSPSDSTAKPATDDYSTNTELNVESKNNLQATAEKKNQKNFSKKIKTTKNKPEEKSETVAVKDETQPESQKININAEPIVESVEPLIAESNQKKEAQNITLIYSAKEVDEYLDKNALAEATSKDKKPSTLKKLLQKANDLKNNQDAFGELRQKKNEILALNFKNEKRGQNK